MMRVNPGTDSCCTMWVLKDQFDHPSHCQGKQQTKLTIVYFRPKNPCCQPRDRSNIRPPVKGLGAATGKWRLAASLVFFYKYVSFARPLNLAAMSFCAPAQKHKIGNTGSHDGFFGPMNLRKEKKLTYIYKFKTDKYSLHRIFSLQNLIEIHPCFDWSDVHGCSIHKWWKFLLLA